MPEKKYWLIIETTDKQRKVCCFRTGQSSRGDGTNYYDKKLCEQDCAKANKIYKGREFMIEEKTIYIHDKIKEKKDDDWGNFGEGKPIDYVKPYKE